VDVKPTLASLLVASALVAGGCSTSAANGSSTLPPAPSSPLVTENFAGTVQIGSSDFHTFTVTSSGFPITADLTTAGPPDTISMGLGVGTVVGGTCQLSSGGFTIAPASSTTPQLTGTIPSGQYCLMVYDVGNQSGPITYTVVVLHY
jgi:hypothetical protein